MIRSWGPPEAWNKGLCGQPVWGCCIHPSLVTEPSACVLATQGPEKSCSKDTCVTQHLLYDLITNHTFLASFKNHQPSQNRGNLVFTYIILEMRQLEPRNRMQLPQCHIPGQGQNCGFLPDYPDPSFSVPGPCAVLQFHVPVQCRVRTGRREGCSSTRALVERWTKEHR